MIDNNYQFDYCPVEPEKVESNNKKTIKRLKVILIIIVLVLLFASLALGYLILKPKVQNSAIFGNSQTAVTPTSATALPSGVPTGSLEQIEQEVNAIKIEDFSSELDTLSEDIEKL